MGTLGSAPPVYERGELLADVLTTFRDPSYTPPVTPIVAMELLALARRPDASFADIARVCEKDPMVAATVLRLAQSAYFSRGAPVASLKDAIVRIGVRTLANLFLEATLTMRVFRAPGYDGAMVSLRRHSAMTAHVARGVASHTALPSENAFVCGLLHDVGVAAAAYVVGARVPHALAWPVILDAHVEAGRTLCKAWRLPAEIEVVVGHHHVGRVGGSLHPGLCVVMVAEWIADSVGFSLEGERPRPRPDNELRLLGIDDATLDTVVADARKIAARIG